MHCSVPGLRVHQGLMHWSMPGLRVHQGLVHCSMQGLRVHQGLMHCSVPGLRVHQGLMHCSMPGLRVHQGLMHCSMPGLRVHQSSCTALCCTSLQEEWSALYDVRTILLSIQSLLAGRCIVASCLCHHPVWLLCVDTCVIASSPTMSTFAPSLPFPEPNPDSPLNLEAAQLWDASREGRIGVLHSYIHSMQQC